MTPRTDAADKEIMMAGSFPISGNDYVAMRHHAEALERELAEARKDAEDGWKAFYALRAQISEANYPGLTGVVRAIDAAIAQPQPESESHRK